MRSHAPLPPTEPRQGCERTAQLSQKNGALARLGSQPLRHMNANTSADGRLGLGPHTGQSDAPVGTKAHAQRGRRQLPASQERCWQVNWTYPAKKPNDRTTSRTVVWTGACCPASAQATRGRVFDGKKSSDNTQERACTCTRAATRHGQLAELHHASCEDHRGLGSTPTQQASRKHRARARARGAT